MSEASCPRCHGTGWICEDHPGSAWRDGQCDVEGCGGAGVACACNPQGKMPQGFHTIASAWVRDLTDADYDALYAAVGDELPRVTRAMFPGILAQQVDRGVIVITVTNEEISVRMPQTPELGTYRVERKRRLH